MITEENTINVGDIDSKDALIVDGQNEGFKDALFFDLEHYVYKKPVCIGVFGCCYFDYEKKEIKTTQYMIENRDELVDILNLAKKYFIKMHEEYGKKYIVTFSGNNDFLVLNYLIKKYNIDYDVKSFYESIDIQKEYERVKHKSIGLKALEKYFCITRESELISGSNLAKTFSKIMKDDDYIKRMPDSKKKKILLYNSQDVVSLFHIYVTWKKYIDKIVVDEKA